MQLLLVLLVTSLMVQNVSTAWAFWSGLPSGRKDAAKPGPAVNDAAMMLRLVAKLPTGLKDVNDEVEKDKETDIPEPADMKKTAEKVTEEKLDNFLADLFSDAVGYLKDRQRGLPSSS